MFNKWCPALLWSLSRVSVCRLWYYYLDPLSYTVYGDFPCTHPPSLHSSLSMVILLALIMSDLALIEAVTGGCPALILTL